MAKKFKEEMAKMKEAVKEEVAKVKEMTAEESRKWRASLAGSAAPIALREEQAREAWRLYWAQEKAKWANSKDLEQIIWLHLKAVSMAAPARFEEGIKHFGLKRLAN